MPSGPIVLGPGFRMCSPLVIDFVLVLRQWRVIPSAFEIVNIRHGIITLHRQFHLISTVILMIKTQKMSENGEIDTDGKNFTLPPAVMAVTNLFLCVE